VEKGTKKAQGIPSENYSQISPETPIGTADGFLGLNIARKGREEQEAKLRGDWENSRLAGRGTVW
jgi:hypothetical protein